MHATSQTIGMRQSLKEKMANLVIELNCFGHFDRFSHFDDHFGHFQSIWKE